MTLLGGIFSRKHKASPRPTAEDNAASEHSAAVSDLDSSHSSPTTSSYATPNRSTPSNPNASNLLHPDSARQDYPHSGQNAPPAMSSPAMSTSTTASSSRLRLFGRKKSAVAEASLPATPAAPRRSFQTAPRPEPGRTSTEVEGVDLRRLRPPPSRSAIFAAYGDPNSALSTRSLPTDTSNSPPSTFYSLAPPPLPPPKKSSIFAWGKNNANATPSPAPSPTRLDTSPLNSYPDSLGSPSSADGGQSFNLRSFRHIRPPSPTGSNASLTPPMPRPRPRGESVNSDASQRISVAAFREAQARRSQAGSPSPSFRSESPALHARGKSPDTGRGMNAPRPSRSTPHIPSQQQRRRSSMAINTTSDSDSTASSSEEDSEDDEAQPGHRGPLSFNKPGNAGKSKAKSEIGHGHAGKTASKSSDFPLPPRGPNSHVGHSFAPAPSSSQQSVNRVDETTKAGNLPPRSQSSLGVYATRQRASVSTSALSPSMAAKRASIVAASNAKISNAPSSDARTSVALSQNGLQTPQLSTQPSKSSLPNQARSNALRQSTVDSSSDSEDDAPLATLVAPRRPGSAMSSYSNQHSGSTGNVTTRSATNMPKPLIDISELTAPKRSYTSPLEKSTAGFTEGPTLLSQAQRKPTQPVYQPSPLVESPVSVHQQLPWQANGSIAPDRELLTATVAPVKFATPLTSPAQERDEFISKTELDAHMSASNGATNQDISSLRRDSSPEMKRDPITDRLTRAIKNTLQATSPSLATTSPVPSSTVRSQQAASPTPRATSPNSGNVSETSTTRLTNGSATPSAAFSVPQSRSSRSEMPFPRSKSSLDASPPDEELAQLLGTAVQFLSGVEPASTPKPAAKNDDTSSDSDSESDSDSDDDVVVASKTMKKSDSEQAASKDRIAPIPIKQRSPPPSFSVTSRPPVSRHNNSNSSSGLSALSSAMTTPSSGSVPRQRSTTLQASSSNTSFGTRKPSGGESISSPIHTSRQGVGSSNGNVALAAAAAATVSTAASSSSSSSSAAQAKPDRGANTLRPPAVRQRSSTMITGVPLSAQMNARVHQPPEKPFAMRRNSPASSTGDSSSGRAPLTPRDGSDIGAKQEGGANGGVDGMRKHIKRRSVSFEDDMDELRPPNRSYLKGPSSSRGSSDAGDMSNEEDQELRRKERRRGEAKAAIELGNVVNGRGPVLDEDDDMPINQGLNQRMSTLNPMMAMGNPMAAMQMGQIGFPGSPNPTPWVNPMGQPMLSPAQFMVPPPADPNFLAAHQHAMAIAKQAYQMAVAQQAMAAAADEWERGSTAGGFAGGSVYGGGSGSVFGGGGGGSVYGGSQMGAPFGMMGGMGMMQGGWGSTASMYGGVGGGTRSMYGGSQLGVPAMMSSSRSEYGGGGGRSGGAGNWSSSRSSYGESFGPEQQTKRNAQVAKRGGRDSGFYPPMPTIASQSTSGRNSPDQRPPARSNKLDSPQRGVRKAPPPSSWKAS